MDQKAWTPADLLQLSGGYWSICALHTGVKLDLFTRLTDRPLGAAELAGQLEVDARGLGMLLDALSAMALLEKRGGSYGASPSAAEYLSRSSSKYLGHIIMHHHHLMDGWLHLDQAVRKGGAVRESVSRCGDESYRESFLMGMFNLAMQLAPLVVKAVDLGGRRRLLDLGGGPGTYAIHFCLQNPALTAVVYDLPSTRRFAEETIARFGLGERIAFNDGDFINSGIEGRYDVAWLSHILHGESPDSCAVILRKAISALEPGGIILVQEFILEDTKDGPLFPALFSLNMLLGTPAGQAYSQAELLDMLAAAGAVDLRRLPVDLPNGAGIIAGSVPAA
ncbi:methyltransferase [Geobacter sp. SVR]|uniref:methyltransferase n=1 Tax=Geobacter sp. SVR TaxID=2495594 RepID=UPI00143F03E3|nr:methyltransferase [Geobacter sp. SVR]BCS53834.1 SAM-dependent methyltransferase [Geobacter sp. SVR]GCF85657.1 SAM-dependent methyltransferase [Geobacter sp. SVR]